MIKRLILAFLIIFLFASFGIAKDKEVTISWTQVLPSPNDMTGWNIYWSETSGGPYKLLTFVQFTGVQTTYTYQGGKIVGKLGKKKTDVYFVIRAVDSEGNISLTSSEVMLKVDTTPTNDTTPPVAPGDVSASKK